jgi:hypothetical protein
MPTQIFPVSSTASAGAAIAMQRAALVRMTAIYTSEIGNPQSAVQLQSLAQQIAEAATALGQAVSLPQGPGATTPVLPAAAAAGDGALPSGYA